MICPKCQFQNQEGTAFCTNCGNSLMTTAPKNKNLLKPLMIGFIILLGASMIIIFTATVKLSGFKDNSPDNQCISKKNLTQGLYESPDKNLALYLSDDGKQMCFKNQITGKTIALLMPTNIHGLSSAKWSSNSQMAVFYEDYQSVFADKNGLGIQQIYFVDREGRIGSFSGEKLGLKPREIPILTIDSWSPLGDWVVAQVGWEGPEEIYLIKPDRSSFKKIGIGTTVEWIDKETMIIEVIPYIECAEPQCPKRTKYKYNITTDKKENIISL